MGMFTYMDIGIHMDMGIHIDMDIHIDMSMLMSIHTGMLMLMDMGMLMSIHTGMLMLMNMGMLMDMGMFSLVITIAFCIISLCITVPCFLTFVVCISASFHMASCMYVIIAPVTEKC